MLSALLYTPLSVLQCFISKRRSLQESICERVHTEPLICRLPNVVNRMCALNLPITSLLINTRTIVSKRQSISAPRSTATKTTMTVWNNFPRRSGLINFPMATWCQDVHLAHIAPRNKTIRRGPKRILGFIREVSEMTNNSDYGGSSRRSAPELDPMRKLFIIVGQRSGRRRRRRHHVRFYEQNSRILLFNISDSTDNIIHKIRAIWCRQRNRNFQ